MPAWGTRGKGLYSRASAAGPSTRRGTALPSLRAGQALAVSPAWAGCPCHASGCASTAWRYPRWMALRQPLRTRGQMTSRNPSNPSSASYLSTFSPGRRQEIKLPSPWGEGGGHAPPGEGSLRQPAGSAEAGVLGPSPRHSIGQRPFTNAGARPIRGGRWCGTGTLARA